MPAAHTSLLEQMTLTCGSGNGAFAATGSQVVLVSTDSDFEHLLKQFPGAKLVMLRSCDYPTKTATEMLRVI